HGNTPESAITVITVYSAVIFPKRAIRAALLILNGVVRKPLPSARQNSYDTSSTTVLQDGHRFRVQSPPAWREAALHALILLIGTNTAQHCSNASAGELSPTVG